MQYNREVINILQLVDSGAPASDTGEDTLVPTVGPGLANLKARFLLVSFRPSDGSLVNDRDGTYYKVEVTWNDTTATIGPRDMIEVVRCPRYKYLEGKTLGIEKMMPYNESAVTGHLIMIAKHGHLF